MSDEDKKKHDTEIKTDETRPATDPTKPAVERRDPARTPDRAVANTGTTDGVIDEATIQKIVNACDPILQQYGYTVALHSVPKPEGEADLKALSASLREKLSGI